MPESQERGGSGPHGPAQRYFVTVHVGERQQMVELSRLQLDLVQPTARSTDGGGAIEGLLSLEEIGRLVEAGHQVTVEAPDYARSRAQQTTTFEAWLEGMGE